MHIWKTLRKQYKWILFVFSYRPTHTGNFFCERQTIFPLNLTEQLLLFYFPTFPYWRALSSRSRFQFQPPFWSRCEFPFSLEVGSVGRRINEEYGTTGRQEASSEKASEDDDDDDDKRNDDDKWEKILSVLFFPFRLLHVSIECFS